MVTAQYFEKQFWKNVEKHFFLKWSPNIVAKNVPTGKNLSIFTMFFLYHLKKTFTSIARISSVFIFKFFIAWDEFSSYLMYRSVVNKSWRALFYCS